MFFRRSIGTRCKDALDYILDCTLKDLCASYFGKCIVVFCNIKQGTSKALCFCIINTPRILIPLRPILGVLQIGIRAKVIENQPLHEDLSDIGSPGAEGPIFQDPPSPDYVPGPEEPEAGTTFTYSMYPFVLGACLRGVLPEDDCSYESDPEEDLEEDDEEDPEEDPADYPADRGDDDDDDDAEEEEHLAPADPTAVAYSADQDPYLAYRVTARMSIRHQAPAPFLSEEVAERLLALPTPPPSPLSPYSSPLPQIPSPPLPISSPPPNGPTYVEGSLGSRAAGIRQRDALPSPVHETEMPEICLPLRKRSRRTTPGLGCEVGESSAAGAARQVGPTTAKADLYGFAEMLDAAPGRQTSKELGYGITDTWDDLVGAIQEIAPTTLEGVNHNRSNLMY
ncbi:hypothetical protein Tco_0771605 [Tanacetum coccineum]|uniref:Uncharacterized protein n=1 Tax=Tanacetum coccineum TaxID=301880 RepID=A0ABQ4ZFK5_9ASTR